MSIPRSPPRPRTLRRTWWSSGGTSHGTHVDLERLLGATVDVVTALSAAFAETVDVPWAVALEATRTGLDHVLGRMEGNQPPSW